jgi:hypothetical protein
MLDRILDLFRAPDPTSGWPLARARPLTLDLETGAINDIRPNAPWTDLQEWGRPANRRPFAHKSFAYPEMGIAFLIEGERVLGAGVEFQPRDVYGLVGPASSCEGFVRARLRMVAAGGSGMLVTAATTPDEVRARLGKAGVDENAEWLVLTYPRPGWELELEFDADRALSGLYITYEENAAT